MSRGTRLERCLEAVASYLHSESLLRPLVVHVRDAHQLDVESVRLVELLALAGEHGRMCVVLDRRHDTTPLPVTRETDHRPRADGPPRRGGHDRRNPRHIGDARALRAHPPPHGRERTVRRTTGGRSGAAGLPGPRSGRAWTLADFGATELPVTLNAALLSRLDHLDPTVTRVVQAASVLGEVFERDVLGAMEVVAGDQLDPLLADCWSRRSVVVCRRPAIQVPSRAPS